MKYNIPESKKKIIAKVKLNLKAGEAVRGQKISPFLNPFGVNMNEFIQLYNSTTREFKGDIIPVIVYIYSNKSFELEFGKPTVLFLLKKYTNIQKGSGFCIKYPAGSISVSILDLIYKNKKSDFNTPDKIKGYNTILGTLNSMGVSLQPSE